MLKSRQIRVIIIGSGAAGLCAALHLADHCEVSLFSKGELNAGSSFYAQGGIAAVLGKEDSIESHIQDTISVGGGLCDENVVRFVANNARDAVKWLINKGVQFTKESRPDGRLDYHLTREGGHSHRRILHVEDATGQEIQTRLIDVVKQHSNITTFKDYTAIDIIDYQGHCNGVYALNNKTDEVETFQAPIVILATGGASKVYLYTSNPDGASGDGIAMAVRRGCPTKNLEFNQFHPTCLYHRQARSFLITEAVRGEGGVLLLADGTRFMLAYDKRAELAPRDIVARAIDHEIKKRGIYCVYLDISFKSDNVIKKRFPNVYKRCLEYGFDITKSPIPVVPAAHYTCGGVVTDLNARTNFPGLYAIGEVAFTGLHGANRMASNSLLECLVFAKAAAYDIKQQLQHLQQLSELPTPPVWDASLVTDSDEQIVLSHNWHEIRQVMWDYVGIARTNKRLERAKRRIDLLKREIQDYYVHFKVSKDLIELRNLVLVADLMVQSAIDRKENIGLHFNLDDKNRARSLRA